MSDSKISGLGAAAALTGLESVAVVQGGVTVRTTVTDVRAGAVRRSFSSQTSAYTVLDTDLGATIFLSPSSTFALSATAASALGAGFRFTVRNVGATFVTFDPNGTELVDGRTTIVVYPGESFDLYCTGAGWYSIGRQRGLVSMLTVAAVTSGASSVECLFSDTELAGIRVMYDGVTGGAGTSIPTISVRTGTYSVSYNGTRFLTGTATLANDTGAASGISLFNVGASNNCGTVDIVNLKAGTASVLTVNAGQSGGKNGVFYGSSNPSAVDGVRMALNTGTFTAGAVRFFGYRT